MGVGGQSIESWPEVVPVPAVVASSAEVGSDGMEDLQIQFFCHGLPDVSSAMDRPVYSRPVAVVGSIF